MKYLRLKNLLIAVLAILTAHFTFAQNDASDYHLDETYPMRKNGKLWMNPEDAKVTVIGSNRSDVHIKVDRIEEVKGFSNRNRKFSIDVESRDGDIFFKERERNNSYVVGSVRLDYTVLVELPQGASLTVRSDDSDYTVTNVNGEIDMSMDDGDATLKSCNGSKFSFDFDDGDLTMDSGTGEIYARLDDGNAYIRNGSYTDVELKVDDGSIVLETDLSDDGTYRIMGDDARIELNVLSGGGEIVVDGDDTSVRASGEFRERESSEDRSVYSLAGGKAKVRIRTDDGRVRISNNSNKM
ncbi:MAG: DUF4097 family beta strand repeat-containing protein [Bacteroidota bacterium]